MEEKKNWRNKPEQISDSYIISEEFADIIVIGAGHAGTAAARAASENGADVIVLEQQPDEKQWVLGIGEIGHINSKWQESKGVPKVDIDEFVNDWQMRTGNRSNYQLIRQYAEECGETFDWFIDVLSEEEKVGIHAMLTPQSENFPKSINGYRAWSGTPNMGMQLQTKAVKWNQKSAKEHGCSFYFDMKASQLIKEGNRITGVIAQDKDGNFHKYFAQKGVILAAGDYSKNKKMCEELLSESADLISDGADFTGHGWDGSGIQMGMWAGGRLEPRSHAAMGGNYSFPGFDLIGSTAVLRVNKHGKRYSNEGFGTHILAATTGAKQPNGTLWAVFDSNIEEEMTYQAPCHAVYDYSDPEVVKYFRTALQKSVSQKDKKESVITTDKAGVKRPLYCADTLEELSEIMFQEENDRESFLVTVRRYNEMCDAKNDTDFGKEDFLLHPIRRAPFFACSQEKNSHKPGGQSLKILVTVSGLLIDEHQQVLDEEFEPIEGLFATGNCSGCRFGTAYTTSLPGQSISIAQTLGRCVGSYLAKK